MYEVSQSQGFWTAGFSSAVSCPGAAFRASLARIAFGNSMLIRLKNQLAIQLEETASSNNDEKSYAVEGNFA